MFNDKYGLTQAVLEGRKTQTRRLINPTMFFQRLETYEGWSSEDIRAWKRSCNRRFYEAKGDMLQQMLDYALSSSHYKVGEEIAVAQSYKDAGIDPFFLLSPLGDGVNAMDSNGWNNKMFVRAELMPHIIKITNIRVERLQDISDEDCLKEGIDKRGGAPMEFYVRGEDDILFDTPQRAFASLIDKTCGKGTWESNPYVFVYEFELTK